MAFAGKHEGFLPLLVAAWTSLLAAVKVQAFSGLSHSCVTKLLLHPLATALRHRSSAVHDAAEEFWSSSGIQAAIQGCDLGLVEAALAQAGSQLSQGGKAAPGLHAIVSSLPHNSFLSAHWCSGGPCFLLS